MKKELRISYCGLDCFECAAYIATQTGDETKLIELGQQWFELENNSTACLCDACRADGRKMLHCSECVIRSCAIEQDVVNCAYCAEYACEKLEEFFGQASISKANLDRIHKGLQ